MDNTLHSIELNLPIWREAHIVICTKRTHYSKKDKLHLFLFYKEYSISGIDLVARNSRDSTFYMRHDHRTERNCHWQEHKVHFNQRPILMNTQDIFAYPNPNSCTLDRLVLLANLKYSLHYWVRSLCNKLCIDLKHYTAHNYHWLASISHSKPKPTLMSIKDTYFYPNPRFCILNLWEIRHQLKRKPH